MAPGTTELFYSRLPVNQIPLSDLLGEQHLFFKIPDNWHVLITDVKRSTGAIENGLHETVNLIATGSIVAVLNIAYKAGVTIPYFFGGDGATFIIPPGLLNSALNALIIHKDNTIRNYNLDLRVGHVPVEDIYAQGHILSICKFRSSDLFAIPLLLGNGLAYAEKLIKGESYQLAPLSLANEDLDLSGMQCRWDKIKPPENFDEVVSLLVIAQEGIEQADAFKRVISQLDRIYGTPERRNPITISRLKLKATLGKIALEMRTKLGGYRPIYLIRTWITTLLGTLYFRTKTGRSYLTKLVDLSDTLVIDGKINTVISGTTTQREQLETALKKLEDEGLIRYGLFVSKESVMSCYVRNLNEDHVHFIDGSDGGYTRAAGMLKRKLFPGFEVQDSRLS
jgi:Protein of unknown function (DUF3095)